MRWLIVPDFHQQIDAVEYLLERERGNYEFVLFMGDYFDSFDKSTSAERTARWLALNMTRKNYFFLLGNHDLQYLFDSRRFRCSGYQGDNMKHYVQHCIRWNTNVDRPEGDLRGEFRLFQQVGPWTISHAGLHPSFIPWQGFSPAWLENECNMALSYALCGSSHPLFEAGADRGGDQRYGGIVWNDWTNLQPVEGLNQLVGHTCRPGSRRSKLDFESKSENHCIDTDGCHAAIIDDASDNPKDIKFIQWMKYPLQSKNRIRAFS
jgi:hypothetical protein